MMMSNNDSLGTGTGGLSLQIPHGSTDTWSATDASRNQLLPIAATLSKLAVKFDTGAGGVVDRTVNVDVNETTNTGITCTANGAATTASDNTHTYSASLADRLQLETTASATPVAQILKSSVLSVRADKFPLMSSTVSGTSTTVTRYNGIQGNSTVTTVAAAEQLWPPEPGTIADFIGYMNGTLTGAGTYTCTLYQNGVSTGVVATFGSSSQSATMSGTTSISVSSSDTFYWEIIPSAGTAPSASRILMLSCTFASTTPGRGVVLYGSATNMNTNTTPTYNWGQSNDAWNTTEANRQAYALACTIKSFNAKISAAPGAAKSRTFTVRKNGAATALTFAISGAVDTAGSVTTDVSFADLDLISVEEVAAGTPTNASAKWGISYEVPVVSAFTPIVAMFMQC